MLMVDWETQEQTIHEGFIQRYGIDYQETFTHVARINSIKAL